MENLNCKPNIRFPEFKGEWNTSKLGDSSSFTKGKGVSKADISTVGKTECIRYGELYTSYNEVINEIISRTDVASKELQLSEANDVIIPASGESQIDIARASCVLKSGVALGGDLNIIKSSLDGIFLAYYLNNKRKLDIARLSQGISVVHLYANQLSSLNIFSPSLPEQQKIAAFITEVDKRLTALKKKKKLLEQYKKGVIQKLFSQEIRFNDENGKGFPDWEKKSLGELLIESNTKSTLNNQYEILSSTARGLFRQRDYFDRVIASKDNIGYKVLKLSQLVFSPQNLWLGNININEEFEIGIVSPSYKIFNFNSSLTSSKFCKYFLTTPRMIFEYKQSSEQGASVVRRNLDLDCFKSISIILPTCPEQKIIASFLLSLDRNLNHYQTQIDKTAEWKKGLLQKMFV